MDARSESLPPRAEALLSQSDWVRALVRGLGVDESGADDVLQSTWMAAIATPPRTDSQGASMRAWIARVARNFALKRLGRDKNRTARERASAKDERLPSAADVVEREEARGQVVQALLDVPEPYRTTLLLRFYENLEPRDIARLQSVPGSTVRNRLRRGLELLRERLERDLGATWRQRCVLVLPLVPAFPVPTGTAHAPNGGSGLGSGGSPSWNPANGTTGGGLVVEKIGLAAAALLAAGGLVLTWTWSVSSGDTSSSSDSSISTELAAGADSKAAEPSGSSVSTELVPAESGRSRERASNQVESSIGGGTGVLGSLRGRLLGPDGQPIQPASQFLRARTFLGGGLVLSSESAGPSAPTIELFKGDVHEGTEKKEGVLVFGVPEGEPGPQPPQRIDDLDATQKGAVEMREKVWSGAPLVGQLFLDTTVGLEIDTDRQPRVVLSNDAGDALEASIDGEGGFLFENLHSDRWHLFAEAPGCQSKRVEVEFAAGQREKTLDVALDAVIRLRVKLVTPDGKDLREAILAEPSLAFPFVPVPFARRACPNERTRDLSGDPARRYGSGRWKNGSDFPDETLGDASGILELSDPLPIFVGVSASGVVLETRLVTSGTEEVVFAIAPEKIRALAATVALRVLSAEDGQPVPGAVVAIEGISDLEPNILGSVEAKSVPPGRRRLVIEAQDHERREEWIDVLPGARTDLGTRSLGRPVEISGRVVDDSGAPLQASVQVGSLGRRVSGSPLPFEGVVDTDADGTFRFLQAGAGTHLLTVVSNDWAAEPMEVDTRGGPVKDLVLRAGERRTVRMMAPFEPSPDSSYLVETANGLPVQISPCEGWTSIEVPLGDGRGWLKLVDGPGVYWKQPIRAQNRASIGSKEPPEQQ